MFLYCAQTTETEFDCSVPTTGRYVTIQRHRQLEEGAVDGGWQMVIGEIDIAVKNEL